MVPVLTRHGASALLLVGAFVLLAGCSPIPVGTLAVSQRDGHLVIAVMRCDDTALQRAGIEHGGPLRQDAPREWIDDARWTADIDDQDIVVLDTADPGEEWDVVDGFEELDPSVSYSAHAGGDSDHPMGSVTFTTADLDALDDGQWLIEGERSGQAGAVRPTTNDLDVHRTRSCER